MSDRRVVITGLGWVTPQGTDVGQVFDDLLACKSWVRPITRFDTTQYTTKFGGEINGSVAMAHLDRRDERRLDRFAQYALNAAIDAVEDSGIDFSKENPWRCGAVIGSGIGGIEEVEIGYQKLLEKGPSRVSPFVVPKLMCNAGSGHVSIHYGLKGPNSATVSACASAAHAIGDAAMAIRHNAADVMVSGGSEAACTAMGVACFVALKALSTRNDDPQRASRPFDVDRDGFILSEGAGIVVLEEYEHAKARGARIYAELKGYGQTADGSHITAPDPEGAGAGHAMELALKDADLGAADVDYINAHGTSTELGDMAECNAIKRTLGSDADKAAVSSTKSMTGHPLGAAGGIEAVIVAKTIETGKIAPTINLDELDEKCAGLDHVANTPREADVRVAMSNSFGFGGHNVALVMARL